MSLAPERPRDGASPSRAESSKARALIPAAPVAPVSLGGCGGSGSSGGSRGGRAACPPWPRWPGHRHHGDEPPSCSREPCPELPPAGRAGGMDGGGSAAASRPAPPPRAAPQHRDPRRHREGTPRQRTGTPGTRHGAEQGEAQAATSEQDSVLWGRHWPQGMGTNSMGCHRPRGMSLTPGDGHRALGTHTEPWKAIDPWGCQ